MSASSACSSWTKGRSGVPLTPLSGGERTKVLLALLFLRDHRFLLIDEPTNHLDMRAREQVAAYLRRKSGFILVSHDRAFLDACVDHVLSLNKTGIEVVSCDFSTFMHNKALREQYEQGENERLKRDIGRLATAARGDRRLVGRGRKDEERGSGQRLRRP